MEEFPCPECDGWMRVGDNRWVCPKCGHRSEEFAEAEQKALGMPKVPDETELAVEQGVATSSPSRAPLAGRPRSFGKSLLLGIVTLGVYFIYWHWQVFSEVHRQEQTRSRGWMVAVAVATSLVAGILGHFADRDGGPPGLAMASLMLSLASTVVLTVYLIRETRGLDAALRRQGSQGTGAVGWLVAFNAVGAVATALLEDAPADAGAAVGLVALILVGLVAYSILQAGLNRYWTGLRTRVAAVPPTALSATPS